MRESKGSPAQGRRDPRPGSFPLGSALSRAAARAVVDGRKTSDGQETRFQVVHRADGSVLEIRGLADKIAAVRRRTSAQWRTRRQCEGVSQ
jgi:hypothetical protein